ncbi:hypothetical protein ACL02R_12310 [Streptomyces sp. MS19]|uniref:hypothetical protein n=1 Tax=Streptomyces sp. MS19 TaxID=3385972 RepID=UPI0039A2C93B
MDELGATAPLGLGEVQVTLGDAPREGPGLDRVLRHLDGMTPRPGAYTEVPPDAGRWVTFTTRVNYEVVRPTEDGWDEDGRPVERAVGPPAVMFWEPHVPWTPWDRATPRLVFHGSPGHLLGLGAQAPEPTGLSVSRSMPPGFMDLLYGSSPRNGEHPGGALGNLLHQLDKREGHVRP